MYTAGTSYWRRTAFTYHPQIGWWFIPGLRARIEHDGAYYRLRTNSAGMRSDREYPLQKPPGRTRIILLGDSYAAGDGVSNGDRACDLLERRFPGLDVLNFGLPNSGTDQQLLVYENIARSYEADAYIFAVTVENILRNVQTCRPSGDIRGSVAFLPKPYFTPDGEGLRLHHQPVPRRRIGADELAAQPGRSPLERENHFADIEAVCRYDADLWELMRRILLRFIDGVAGKPVFLIPLPLYYFFLDGAAPRYLDRFREFERSDMRCSVIDPLPYFLNLPFAERVRCRFPHDAHYTPAGHEIVARAIIDHLTKRMPALLTEGR